MIGTTEVVVIGGGYAGVLAASRLTRRDDVRVTLINPRAQFVDRIRLHQLVGGSADAVVDYRAVLAARVRRVVDTVTRIDAAARRLRLASGADVGYDHLVYAVGSAGAEPPHTYPVATLEQARRLRAALLAAPAAAPVTVVGAGPTGIETAAELAGAGRRVTLIGDAVLGPYLHRRARRAVVARLAQLGVRVLTGPVTAVTGDAVRLPDGRELPSAVTVWAAGFGVPDLAARSGLSVDAAGRLRTDETLTSVDDQRIVAAGDAAAPSDLPVRMSCQAAVQLGPQAAATVLSRIAGRPPRPLDVGFAGQCLSLGRGAGLFQFAARDDTATRFHVAGRAGAGIKEVICRGIRRQLAYEARHPGARDWWATDARRRERLRARPDVRG